MKLNRIALSTSLFAVGASAFAGQTSNTTAVSATIIANCTSLTSPDTLAFGNVNQGDGSSVTGDVSVVCGTGTAYSVAFEGGANLANSTRNLAKGTELLPYALYQTDGTTPVGTANANANYTVVTSAFAGANAITGTGTGASQSVTKLTAKLLAADTLTHPAGVYSDSVRVVLSF